MEELLYLRVSRSPIERQPTARLHQHDALTVQEYAIHKMSFIVEVDI